MNNLILAIIVLIIIMGFYYQTSTSTYENFLADDSDQPRNQLPYGKLQYNDFPVNREGMIFYWGPYLWGTENRPFYDYGPNTRAPYPYAIECDSFAQDACENSCDQFCYKKHYLKCAAGVALVNPEKLCHSKQQ